MIDNYEVTIKTFSIKLGEEIELNNLKGLVEEAEVAMTRFEALERPEIEEKVVDTEEEEV